MTIEEFTYEYEKLGLSVEYIVIPENEDERIRVIETAKEILEKK